MTTHHRPTTVDECHDWLTPHDLNALTLKAFHTVREYLQSQQAGCLAAGWNYGWSRHEFAEVLADVIEAEIYNHGFKRGAEGFTSWRYETLAWWLES